MKHMPVNQRRMRRERRSRVARLGGAYFAALALAACGGTQVTASQVPVTVDIGPARGAHCGTEVETRIDVRPTRGLEFTHGHPMTLTIAGPGPEDVVVLQANDALVLESDEVAFIHTFRPTEGGNARFAGTLSFRVCSNVACAPEFWPVDWRISVSCDAPGADAAESAGANVAVRTPQR